MLKKEVSRSPISLSDFKPTYLREFLELDAQILGGGRPTSNSFISGVFCGCGSSQEGYPPPFLSDSDFSNVILLCVEYGGGYPSPDESDHKRPRKWMN